MAWILNYNECPGRRTTMLTNVSTSADLLHLESRAAAATTTAQKVVIINGSTEVLELLETVLDAGHYDVVFVESTRHAYSQIKRVLPNLVILCLRLTLGDQSVVVKGRVVHCSISDVEQEGVVYRSGIEFIESSERVYGVIAGFIDAVRAGRRAV